MSCHDIGHGLNTVSIKVLELYDEGKIDFTIAKDLLCTIEKGVHWCDGNEYEAVECLEDCRCGRCLVETDDLHSIQEETTVEWNEVFKILGNKEDRIFLDGVCEKCLKEICEKYNLSLRK